MSVKQVKLSELDVRHKAAALFLQILEVEGLTVTQKQRLHVLQKVANAAATLAAEAYAIEDDDTYEYVTSSNMDALRDALADLEAVEGDNAQGISVSSISDETTTETTGHSS